MRWLPPILFFGILLNVALCLVFRLRVDRLASERFESFRSRAFADITALTADALYSIDQHFLSNKLAVSNSPATASPSKSSDSVDDDFPILRSAGSWKYHYFELGNNRFARVGVRNYGEGDFFPRGGLITNIHPDGIVIDGKYWVSNSSSASDRFDDLKKDIKPLKELKK